MIRPTTPHTRVRPARAVIALSLLALAVTMALGSAAAPDADRAALEAAQSATNAEPGPRRIPGRTVAVPETVSPESQALVAAPYSPFWNAAGTTPAEWRAIAAGANAAAVPGLVELRTALGVELEEITIGGVPCFVLTPETLSDAHRGRTVLNFHGGGYIYGAGVAGTYEATLMAAYGGYRVIAVDYRMPPAEPYPAAVNDAVAVYRALVEDEDVEPSRLAVNGTSAGGGLALALALRIKEMGLPAPGALALNTPWADLTGSGDSYQANEWLDNVVVSYEGYLDAAARLYAGDRSLTEPELSPVYGDLEGLPPTILIAGTRDLLLSDSVRVQRKLSRGGVTVDLQLFEGFSHGQYLFDPSAPETREIFREITRFLDAHLGA